MSAIAVIIPLTTWAGCTNDDEISRHGWPIATVGVGAPWGEVAIDKVLLYEGSRFQLTSIQEAQFVDETAFAMVGRGAFEGADDSSASVFVRSGERDAVYTQSEAGLAPDWIRQPDTLNTPALWYRWDRIQ